MSAPDQIFAFPDSPSLETRERWMSGRWYRQATGAGLVRYTRSDIADEWKRQRDEAVEKGRKEIS